MQGLLKKEIKMETGNRSATDVIVKWQKPIVDLLTKHDFISMPELHPNEFVTTLQETSLPQDLGSFIKSEYLGLFKPYNKNLSTFFAKVKAELENRLKFQATTPVDTTGAKSRQMHALQEEIKALKRAAGNGRIGKQ